MAHLPFIALPWICGLLKFAVESNTFLFKNSKVFKNYVTATSIRKAVHNAALLYIYTLKIFVFAFYYRILCFIAHTAENKRGNPFVMLVLNDLKKLQ